MQNSLDPAASNEWLPLTARKFTGAANRSKRPSGEPCVECIKERREGEAGRELFSKGRKRVKEGEREGKEGGDEWREGRRKKEVREEGTDGGRGRWEKVVKDEGTDGRKGEGGRRK